MASLGPVRTIAVAGTHVISQMKKNLAARAKTKAIQPTRQTFSMSPVWWLQKVMQDWGNSFKKSCKTGEILTFVSVSKNTMPLQRFRTLSFTNAMMNYR